MIKLFRLTGFAKWLLLFFPYGLLAQGNDTFLTCMFESVGAYGQGDNAPFWHTSNRQGLSSVNTEWALMHLGAVGGMPVCKGLSLDYGVDLGLAAGMRSNLFVHQLYADLDYKWLGLEMGMKERWGELKNRSLSTGGLTWSGNSQPIPQIRAGIPEFVRIPILGGWFSVKGHVAYGRFTDDKWRKERAENGPFKDRYTDGLLFHSKDLFIRVGNADRFPLQVTLGLEMYSVFGGTLHNRPLEGTEILQEYKMPTDANAYLSALIPFNKVGEQGKENGDILGSWHLSVDYTGKDWGARFYYEHFFEDHSSLIGVEYKNDLEGKKSFVSYGFKHNWLDGLFGIEVNLPDRLPVRCVVFEILNTRGQCGPVYKATMFPVLEGVDGRDGMYTHEVYDSYSMAGNAIGSPILVSPVYNKDCNQRFRSNRVLMYHLGVDGQIGKRWDYRALFTTTAHWGTYEDPFNEKQRVTSCLFEGFCRLGDADGWKVGLSLGFDINDGDLTGNNTGLLLTVSRLWRVL